LDGDVPDWIDLHGTDVPTLVARWHEQQPIAFGPIKVWYEDPAVLLAFFDAVDAAGYGPAQQIIWRIFPGRPGSPGLKGLIDHPTRDEIVALQPS